MEGAQHSLADGVLLIGDNSFLLRLVATNLAPLNAASILLDPETNVIPANTDSAHDGRPYKLILLALSRSSNEPVVVLARAGLTQLVGLTPLLIISDRAFQADPVRHIFHLQFPFSAEALRQQVAELLAPCAEPGPSEDPAAVHQPAAGLQITLGKLPG